jgi:hypothetical protein
VSCAEGKQSKNKQSRQDTDSLGLTDRFGVINPDCKGPMSPADRYGNRYFSVFVDHKSNAVRVFLGKNKSSVASNLRILWRTLSVPFLAKS